MVVTKKSIRVFWTTSGLSPTKIFYHTEAQHRCTVCCKVYKRAQDLKAHKTRAGHHQEKTNKITKAAFKEAEEKIRKQQQSQLDKVMWKDTAAGNVWLFKYLGSIFEAGGSQLKDISIRLAMARERFGQMRHIW